MTVTRSPRGNGTLGRPGDEFSRATDPFRRELLAYCYRMLGSVHDAEDLVQETLVRAWRSYGDFDENKASLRTWLYRIATNVCLTAIQQRHRRALPSGISAPSSGSETASTPVGSHVAWLEPIPNSLLERPDDPAMIVMSQARVRLALIAALQYLPARQRAVLILREVLAWRASEVAEVLDTSTDAVNAVLHRARARIAQSGALEDDLAEPNDAAQRKVLEQYVTAFTSADIQTLVSLLRHDVELEMPPIPMWFRGRDHVTRFLASKILVDPGTWLMVPAAANGQPAVAAYRRSSDGPYSAHSIHVLEMTDTWITRIIAFQDTRLFPSFGLAVSRPEP